jgi:coenzyme F420-reducing hydrogenase delta subunit
MSLVCERSCDLNAQLDSQGRLTAVPEVQVVKFPCSGMIQPLMVEAAFKAGATGVIITGCQLGDCYYREGNRMIRERLLGGRPPGLKKTVDRRRVIGLWLSRPQASRFISEAKEFLAVVTELGPVAPEPAKPTPAPKPAPQPKSEAKSEPENNKAPAGEAKSSKATAPADPGPEPAAQPKSETKDEPKTESKPEAKEEGKPES